MALGQTDLSIILGRSQNQAIKIMTTEALIEHVEDVENYITTNTKMYDNLVDLLFKKNKEQHERLVVIQQVPQKKEEQKAQEESKFKDCPKCHKPILKSWKFHQDCGWKGETK